MDLAADSVVLDAASGFTGHCAVTRPSYQVPQVHVDAVADARAADLVEQADVLIDRRPVEEAQLDGAPILTTVPFGEHLVVIVERGSQCLPRQRNAVGHQTQVCPRPFRGDEPPRGHTVGRSVGPDPASADEKLAPLLELDPQKTDRLGVVADVEHPGLQDAALLPGCVDATLAGRQQEGQEHVHRRRLAGAVHASQQQPAAGEFKHLVLILVDVDDSRTVQTSARAHSGSIVGWFVKL